MSCCSLSLSLSRTNVKYKKKSRRLQRQDLKNQPKDLSYFLFAGLVLGKELIKGVENMELEGTVQTYHWGKHGLTSKVAHLASKNSPDFVVDPDGHYAEYWMGTHPNGPSTLKKNGTPLGDYLKENPHVLGEEASNRTNIPYLFKVLSVETALSIQAHPDKHHAEELFRTKPGIYKDDNHKPEMALAITEFEGLCGFRPLEEIKRNLRDKCPELGRLVKCDALLRADASSYAAELKSCFGNLMRCGKDELEVVLEDFKVAVAERRVRMRTTRCSCG